MAVDRCRGWTIVCGEASPAFPVGVPFIDDILEDEPVGVVFSSSSSVVLVALSAVMDENEEQNVVAAVWVSSSQSLGTMPQQSMPLFLSKMVGRCASIGHRFFRDPARHATHLSTRLMRLKLFMSSFMNVFVCSKSLYD